MVETARVCVSDVCERLCSWIFVWVSDIEWESVRGRLLQCIQVHSMRSNDLPRRHVRASFCAYSIRCSENSATFKFRSMQSATFQDRCRGFSLSTYQSTNLPICISTHISAKTWKLFILVHTLRTAGNDGRACARFLSRSGRSTCAYCGVEAKLDLNG